MALQPLYRRYFGLTRALSWDQICTPPTILRSNPTRKLHCVQGLISNHLTDEQKAIVHSAKCQNVIVTAVPGSGKSTVALEVLKSNPPNTGLLITYSKDLQTSTVLKAERLGIEDHSSILTIHSMAGSLFGRTIKDDYDLQKCLEEANPGTLDPNCYLNFKQVIIDEAQDLQPLYFQFCRILLTMIARATGTPPRLLCLGDPKQAIFEHNKADARFLTKAETLFGDLCPSGFSYRQMTQTHRFGNTIAEFVNIQLEDGYPRIRGSPRCIQKRPIFMPINIWEMDRLAHRLAPLIDEYGPENVAIIAPSTKPTTPIMRLANELSLLKYPIAGAPSDGVKFNSKTSKHKIEVKSVHKYKGKERRLVFYFIDGSYYEHYGKGIRDDILSNDIYVAFTRAQEQLVILHEYKKPLLPTLSPASLAATCDIIDPDQLGFRDTYIPRNPSSGISMPKDGIVSVADLLKSVPSDDLFYALESICAQVLGDENSKSKQIRAPDHVCSKPFGGPELYEPVSDFVGMAITASFEHAKTGRCTSLGYGVEGNEKTPDIPQNSIKRARWFAREAVYHDSKRQSFIPRSRQMAGNSCSWLCEVLPETDGRLKEYIGDHPSTLFFEQPVTSAIEVDGKTLTLKGYVDIVQQHSEGGVPILHEIKFVSDLSREALLQVAIYGYLWSVTHGMDELPVMRVYNVQKGEAWSVESTLKDVESIIQKLVKAKYRYGNKASDEEFLADCESIKRKVAAVFDSATEVQDGRIIAMPVLPGKRRKSVPRASRLKA